MAHPAEAQGEAKPGLKSVSQLRSPEDLQRKLDALKRGRGSLEQQWKLNLAFYKGRQYTYYNRASRRLESLPTEDGDKPRHVVRLVSNQILTGAHSLLSKLTKTKPQMWATPASGSDSDVKAAQMAEALLEYWWYDHNLDDMLEEALLWSIVAGQGYWKISWDQHAGKQQRFTLAPDGSPITDGPLKDAYRSQLEKLGADPSQFEKVVYLGDIRVETLSPFDVYLDPSAKTFQDCKYAICVHHLDPDEIKTRWGVDIKPDSVSAAPDVSLPFSNAEDASEPTVKKVNIGYFLPNAAMPQGRYVVWINEPHQILEDGPWPYPFNELPLVKFPGIRVPGAVYDTCETEHAIPIQKEVNRTISQIVQYKNLTIKPRVWAPVGSLATRLTTEGGALYEYNPIAGEKPEVERLPALPPYVFEHLAEQSARLKDIFSVTEVTEGQLPPNLEAGVAIDLLQEMATDRLAPRVKLIERALARAGEQMLKLAQTYYVEPRLLQIKGSGGAIQVRRFKGADLEGASIRVDVGSGLPRTRAARQARIERLVELGIIPAEQAYKHLELADMQALAKAWATHEEKAYREHDKLNTGEILNPLQLQIAQASVEQGINPETGEPLTGDPMEIEAVLMNAALAPGIADNHQMHLDVHGQFLNSIEFQNMPPEVQQSYFTHYQLTQAAASSLPTPQPEAPRVNLQIKSTAGPTVQSKILQQAGVPVTPEDSSELPLETWVTDSMDKPDMDEAANDPHTKKDEELFAKQKAREQKAKADLAEKKARQSDFRPKKAAK
jgi:hypothetical protein